MRTPLMVVVGTLLLMPSLGRTESWISCDPDKSLTVLQPPAGKPHQVQDLAAVDDGHNLHLFWYRPGETNTLWHLLLDRTGLQLSPPAEPTQLGTIRRGYRASLEPGGLSVAWVPVGDGANYRRWDRGGRTWRPAERLTAELRARQPQVFPGLNAAFWTENVHLDETPAYRAGPQAKAPAEFMSVIHQTRELMKFARRAGDPGVWSGPVNVPSLSDGSLDIDDYVAVPQGKRGFSIFVMTSGRQTQAGKECRWYRFDPDAGSTTLQGTWRSSSETPSFVVLPHPTKTMCHLFWSDTDKATGHEKLFYSSSDKPNRVVQIPQDAREDAAGPGAATFRTIGSSDFGLAAWMSFSEGPRRSIMISRYLNGEWSQPGRLPFSSVPDAILLTGDTSGLFCFGARQEIKLVPFQVQWR